MMTPNNTGHFEPAQNTFNQGWIHAKKYLYLTSLVLPALPIASAATAHLTGNGLWFWIFVVGFYFVLPPLDHLLGEDPANPSGDTEEQLRNERYYVRIMYVATALHWLAVFAMAAVVGLGDWPWYHVVGAALSLGLASGLALVAGHELGHKINDRKQMFAAKMILACSGYGHFTIEHNKGHHKDVATPDDPASSRFGESIYRFVLREIPGAAKRAWQLESQRLKRQGKAVWSLDNEILQPALVTAVAYSVLIAAFGAVMIPFLLIASAYAWWQLTCANYVEHYGLLRRKNAEGRFERCQPCHSWNSNRKASNLILLHLQRHSDHHARPTVPYQILRDYGDVPTLPSGYPFMFLLAMLPPLWFLVMNPRVVAAVEGDQERINLAPHKPVSYLQRHLRTAQANA